MKILFFVGKEVYAQSTKNESKDVDVNKPINEWHTCNFRQFCTSPTKKYLPRISFKKNVMTHDESQHCVKLAGTLQISVCSCHKILPMEQAKRN